MDVNKVESVVPPSNRTLISKETLDTYAPTVEFLTSMFQSIDKKFSGFTNSIINSDLFKYAVKIYTVKNDESEPVQKLEVGIMRSISAVSFVAVMGTAATGAIVVASAASLAIAGVVMVGLSVVLSRSDFDNNMGDEAPPANPQVVNADPAIPNS